MLKSCCRLALVIPAAMPCAAIAQNTIVVAESPRPAWERETIQVRCGENILAVSLERDGYRPARLTGITINGLPARVAEQEEIEEFVEGLGGASISATFCKSPTSFGLGISGSRYDTAPGEEDDIVEVFAVTFEPL